ncbi:putative helicase [Vibrio phage RYC]|nr:putative helicase [Vibrio phage RYC]
MSTEDIDSYRVTSSGVYCIANEMIEAGIKNGDEEYRDCGSSDAMHVFENVNEKGDVHYSGYCFSCSQAFHKKAFHNSSHAPDYGIEGGKITEKKKFEPKTKQKPITNDEIKEILSYGFEGKGYRNLMDKYLKFFGHSVKMARGKPNTVYYPETRDGKLKGYKSRTLPKSFGWDNKGQTGMKSDLSGQRKFKDQHFRDILIVGGEEDKVAAFQIFDLYQEERYKHSDQEYAPMPVVSPTTGESSALKQIRDQYDFINRAENIYLGLDNDEVGRAAMDEIAELFPKEKVKIIHWTHKDPNQFIFNKEKKDYSAQFIRDFWNAKPFVQTGTRSSKDIYKDVSEELLKPRISLPPYMSKIARMMGGNSKDEGLLQGRIVNIIGDTSVGKCESKDTPILMHNGLIKMIQDVEVGDLVMGDDGSPREVLGLSRGRDVMYRVDQTDGDSYTVNSKHVLALRAGYDTNYDGGTRSKSRRCGVDFKKGDYVNISVSEYLKLPFTARRSLKGYKGILRNLDNGAKVRHPWLLGMWLGDGDSDSARITQANTANECISEFYKISEDFNYSISEIAPKDSVKRYSFTNGLRRYLRENNLLKNKHIPKEWLCSSWDTRVELLSGLLDSDGHYSKGKGYEITQKNKQLAEDIVFLAKSLGLKCSFKETYKKSQNGTEGLYYRMFISGDTSILNLRLSYKQPEPVSELRKLQNTSITVTELGEDDYYGISVDGNHLYCLGDFTVTHNTTHVNAMVYHWIFNSPQKPCIASLEATAGQYAIDMISLHLGENIRNGRTNKEVVEYLETPEVEARLTDLWENEWGEERFQIIDERDGTIHDLENQMERAFHKDGCGLFVIDVLTDVLRNMSNEQQSEHMTWQKNMVKKGATIVNILHTKKPTRRADGTLNRISEYDALGSSTFVQSAAVNILIDRDKMAEDPIEKNTTRARMPKCREGSTGDAGEWYFDTGTRIVHDRDEFFAKNPELLPEGYDLKANPYAQEEDKFPQKKRATSKMKEAVADAFSEMDDGLPI